MQVSAAVSEAAAPSEKVASPAGNMWDAFAKDVYKFQSATGGQEVPSVHHEFEGEGDDLDAAWRDPGPSRSDEEIEDKSDSD